MFSVRISQFIFAVACINSSLRCRQIQKPCNFIERPKEAHELFVSIGIVDSALINELSEQENRGFGTRD
jgi:hypothetical protein